MAVLGFVNDYDDNDDDDDEAAASKQTMKDL